VQGQAREAADASERIVSATRDQSEAVAELSKRVDKLTTDTK